ncbi:MAG TPA: hypothetical protein VM118_00440, partial [Acidobacteriota bacterium]|nr:hypothetical protein [Acidobacteriota bacterium]
MKRLLVLLLFLATPAMAADWYFSDCATYCQDGAVAIGTGACTGAGTDINNPICLDWDNDGSDEGWGYVQDGTAPEVGSGDTVYLCCGDCDGAGTCTHNQDDVITIQNAGPVTVSGYPGETVTYDGGSTVADYTLGVVRHVYVTVETYDDWTFQNYNLQHYQSYFFHALNAPDGWTIQNMTMKWLDALQDDSSVGDTSTCGKGYAGDTYGIYFRTGNPSGAPTATLTIANIDMHSICKFALRFNSLSNGTAIIVEDNTFYNMAGVTNGFNNSGQRIRRNTVYDVEVPFSEEWGTIDLIIEDNIIECRGTYNMDSGRCQQAIQINESDNPPGEIDGICNDIIIRRNKIIGYASSGQGSWYSGITYLCECLDSNGCVTLNATIENNFLQRIVPNITGGTCLGPRHGLSLITNKPVTVRHNTIRESSLGMIICGNGTVAHNVYGNIIEDPLDALPGVWIEA